MSLIIIYNWLFIQDYDTLILTTSKKKRTWTGIRCNRIQSDIQNWKLALPSILFFSLILRVSTFPKMIDLIKPKKLVYLLIYRHKCWPKPKLPDRQFSDRYQSVLFRAFYIFRRILAGR